MAMKRVQQAVADLTVGVSSESKQKLATTSSFSPLKGDSSGASSVSSLPPDDYISSLVIRIQSPLTGLVLQDLKYRLKTHRQCFTGRDLVDWIVEQMTNDFGLSGGISLADHSMLSTTTPHTASSNDGVISREEAIQIGEKMLRTGAFRPIGLTMNISFRSSIAAPQLVDSSSQLYQLTPSKTLEDVRYGDDLVKEFLLFRGMSKTLMAFDNETKEDPTQSFEVGKIVKQLYRYIHVYNLPSLLIFWKYMDEFLFNKLDHHLQQQSKSLCLSIKKYYLINALEHQVFAKVNEFYTTLSGEMANDDNWSVWFTLPYVKNPQEHEIFRMYFTRQWKDNLSLSLHNFLVTSLHYLHMPKLLLFNFERETRRSLEFEIETLHAEIESLKKQLKSQQEDLKGKGKGAVTVVSGSATAAVGLGSDSAAVSASSGSGPQAPVPPLGLVSPASSPALVSPRALSDDEPSDRDKAKPKRGVDSLLGAQRRIPNPNGPAEDSDAIVDRKSLFIAPLDFSPLPTRIRSNSDPKVQDQLINKEKEKEKLKVKFQDSDQTKESDVELDTFSVELNKVTDANMGYPQRVKFSKSGNYFAGGSTDGNLRIWKTPPIPIHLSVPTGQTLVPIATFFCNSDVRSIDWDESDIVIAGTSSSSIKLFDINKAKLVADILIAKRIPLITSLAVSPTKKTFICAARNYSLDAGGLLIWDMVHYSKAQEIIIEPETAMNCVMYHNENHIVAGGADGVIRIIDRRTGSSERGFQCHGGDVVGIASTSEPSYVLTLGLDSQLHLWDIRSQGRKILSFKFSGRQKYIGKSTNVIFCDDISFNSSKKYFGVGSSDGVVDLFKYGQAEAVQKNYWPYISGHQHIFPSKI